jgi:hypothetical protein
MSEEIAEAAADRAAAIRHVARIAELEVQLDIERKFEAHWRQQGAKAWELVGQLDYALQYQIGEAKTLPAAKKVAQALRQRIAAALSIEDRREP